MPRAELRPLEKWSGACPSCGRMGHPRLQLLTEKKRLAWDGCVFCWELAGRRNQAETLRLLCRVADVDKKPGPNPQALR